MYDFLEVVNRDHSSKLLSFWKKSRFCILARDRRDKQTDGHAVTSGVHYSSCFHYCSPVIVLCYRDDSESVSLTLYLCRETTKIVYIPCVAVGDCLVTVDAYGEYMGQIAETKSGKTCQAWASQSPHSHGYGKDEMFPEGSAEDAKNYCRNPDGSSYLWCYTTDPSTSWEKCVVPLCGESTSCRAWVSVEMMVSFHAKIGLINPFYTVVQKKTRQLWRTITTTQFSWF